MIGTDEIPTERSPDVQGGADVKARATRRAVTAASGDAGRTGDAPVTLDTATLFGGRSEVRLLHRGQEYRLRVTRQGKLILTK